jgi:hypothetical protein
MLKNASSFVLASLGELSVPENVRLAASPHCALLEALLNIPAEMCLRY